MPSKSKIKGNNGEHEVAALFSQWWGEPFKRIPNSGALRWKGVTWTYGDLLPPVSCPVVVECKRHAKVDLDAVLRLDKEHCPILQWWAQVCEDAARCLLETEQRVEPMLCYRQDYGDWRLCIRHRFFNSVHSQIWAQLNHVAVHLVAVASFVVVPLVSFQGTLGRDEFIMAYERGNYSA